LIHFFFSSRRRHTRCYRDWSSDVCSSDLKGHTRADGFAALEIVRQAGITLRASLVPFTPWATLDDYLELFDIVASHDLIDATDEIGKRRVGKECRGRVDA